MEFNLSPEILELDYAAGSIGVDLRGEFPVTRVELTPESPVHRVKPRHLMVYVSNDNSSYTEVKDWEAATGAGGEMIITFATPVAARFIKVQCQFDDRDRAFEPVNRAEFKHKPEELIKVYYTITSRYEEYAYDASGNRVQERITLRMTETRNYSYYPNSSRLRTNGVYGFVYDANGNLIRKGTSFTITGNGIELKDEGEYWEYRYDLLNRLTEVKKNGSIVARYWYDETGLRVKKESGNGTIYYVFNLEGQVLYEEENQGYVEYIYLLGRHFARVDGDRSTQERTTYFYHTDHLGSTVLVTDETGATVWSTEYTPFGSLTFEEGKLKRAAKFTGKDLDEDTGLYYFNARWYDQSIGRFISEDTYKGEPHDPKTSNLYVYVGNNPLRYIDPTGNRWVDTTVVVIGFTDNSIMTFSAMNIDPQGLTRVYNALLNARMQELNVARFRCEVYHENFIERAFKKAFSFFGFEIGGSRVRNIELMQSYGHDIFQLPADKNRDLGADIAAFMLNQAGIGTYEIADKLVEKMFGTSTIGKVAGNLIKATNIADSISKLAPAKGTDILSEEAIGFDYLTKIFVMNPEQAKSYFDNFEIIAGFINGPRKRHLKDYGISEASKIMHATVVSRRYVDRLEIEQFRDISKELFTEFLGVGLDILSFSLTLASSL